MPHALHRSDPAVLGPYRLVGRLSSGGMGRVYLAVRAGTAELAAVKTLLVENDISTADRARFAREVAVAQRVAGRHTARVLAADPGAAWPWLATEYIAAPSLGELTARGGPADPGTVARLARNCAAALESLHAAGVVHRDLKPHNLLLTPDGIRIIDFGISHATDLTQTRLTLGTIAYIAPEQARGMPATPASDIYALGTTLCAVATGRPPYPQTGDPVQLLALVSRGAVNFSGVPDPLLGLVRACLAADPADRPQSAEVRALADETEIAGPSLGQVLPGLPNSWARIIFAYDQQGRELRRQHALRADVPAPQTAVPARRIAGLTPRGWRAACSLSANLVALGCLTLGGLAAIVIVIFIAAQGVLW
ncbi:serine/threonine-protein kinase [Streptomyces griseocarneus]|uniref:serine/threonine-protein kinase n=1 Tax=Streptomyces griseocarneus TaxID=51201 RepID=UPI001CC92109|nr:serine/threonine-protein kinase [Streptomyces griseocarneus]MBZ6478115.1 serine/threonine protein kinase [Streptomyces griseocarneus]